MRRLFSLILLMSCTLPVWADSLDQLYKTAGWPEQRAHFTDALNAAQQRYRNSLPPAVYQALVSNSNQRFQAQAVDRRALAQLRSALPNPSPALAFFQSPLGRKIVAAELRATRKDELAKNADGLPKIQASDDRMLIIGHLAQALPAREAGAEVSLAIAGMAADSLSSMIPGLLGGGQAQGLLDGQRQRLMKQIGQDLNNTLLYVYRDLTDAELEAFATFAESNDGKAYYRAALAAIRAGLAVGQSTGELN
ncbi:UNVERIFIED_ORG: hypothetical protein J2W65_000247 [Pseudomonas parafulva]|jgi:hypothetical protein|uniref:DUF2059 domain-containing protein n=2 Tax=Gammaproteobacteria TaxID=1236 RepID=A0A2L1WIS7_9PSED|nr:MULTISPECIES: DUF2059 domain-containing protein [Pseudomonas]MCY4126099.1 DUF2059 domain-containing protein [Pseudomonas sp.]MDP9554649.1 hypothetical protein [Pseudomonas parafulva]MDP9662545.1 hypothetical protein [Pseudomonas cremoricolorata]AVF57397.1 DUF2059 domain-containing protein [Pseudomonas fulva]MBA1205698.1 DUF2059 domain-containing protein [Pseudomonas fulva]